MIIPNKEKYKQPFANVQMALQVIKNFSSDKNLSGYMTDPDVKLKVLSLESDFRMLENFINSDGYFEPEIQKFLSKIQQEESYMISMIAAAKTSKVIRPKHLLHSGGCEM